MQRTNSLGRPGELRIQLDRALEVVLTYVTATSLSRESTSTAFCFAGASAHVTNPTEVSLPARSISNCCGSIINCPYLRLRRRLKAVATSSAFSLRLQRSIQRTFRRDRGRGPTVLPVFESCLSRYLALVNPCRT